MFDSEYASALFTAFHWLMFVWMVLYFRARFRQKREREAKEKSRRRAGEESKRSAKEEQGTERRTDRAEERRPLKSGEEWPVRANNDYSNDFKWLFFGWRISVCPLICVQALGAFSAVARFELLRLIHTG